MSMDEVEVGGAGTAQLGLRLLTLNSGPEGYGFHMYTNTTLKGQYVKWVLPNGPAALSGLLCGDHVLEVDGVNVTEDPHQKVVERVRCGSGKGKKLLVVDMATEHDMAEKGEEMRLSSYNAVVMIPRAPTAVSQRQAEEPLGGSGRDEEVDAGPSMPISLDISAAIPPKNSPRRAQVKSRDWRASIQAYNRL